LVAILVIWRVMATPPLLRANAADLKATVVTPHLEAPITGGKNLLWCSTFQLAWNEACKLIGEDIHLDVEPPMVPILNKKSATASDLDAASYVALAGRTEEGILAKIRDALNQKFGSEAAPELLPQTLPADYLVAYSYLSKDLRFAVPFQRIKEQRLFRGKPVQCFGLMGGGHPTQTRQVLILSDEREHGTAGFVIELKTTSPDDRLILACIEPEPTLRETIDRVHALIAKSAETEAYESGLLFVPKLNFHLLRQYNELVGKRLKVGNSRANGLPIALAEQDIRFQLNETGARLKSEAKLPVPVSRPSEGYIFDRPFLILLERRDAKAPYFALWVDNAELLVPD
jgi:hypothetical protein